MTRGAKYKKNCFSLKNYVGKIIVHKPYCAYKIVAITWLHSISWKVLYHPMGITNLCTS